MTESIVRLETSIEDHTPEPVIPIRWLSDKSRSTISLTQSSPICQMGSHTEAAEDLLAVAVAAYCADRSIVREGQPDGWTRQITIDVPVRNPGRWDDDLLQRTLSFLTGDHWHIRLRRGLPHPGLHTTDPALITAESAVLFSGGVDSLAWVCEALHTGESVALVSYFGDGPTGHLQEDMKTQLGGYFPSYRFQIKQTPASGESKRQGFVDKTMRSRSLLFLALGVLVACTQHAERLWMAENGYIAVNVPLHEGRIGSLSTRSAHPQFVDSLNQVLAAAEVGVEIKNPYLLMTKGEVTERLIRHAPHLAWDTISCAHPTEGRWRDEGFGSCGYCYPCIIRQAGFHHLGSDHTAYKVDPFTTTGFYARGKPSSDARAVARFLLDPVQLGDVQATGRVGSFAMAQQLHKMCQRGAAELSSLFDERATSAVKAELGL